MSIRRAYELSKRRGMEFDEVDWLYSFLLWFVKLGKIRYRDLDEYFGKLFNYPACCIEHFIQLDEAGIIDIYKYNVSRYNQPRGRGYVMCPKCIEKEKTHHEG